MARHARQPTINFALRDASFSVEQCKTLCTRATMPTAKLIGDVDLPRCLAPWLNLPKVLKFALEIEASFPTVKTKEELEDLLWSWFN